MNYPEKSELIEEMLARIYLLEQYIMLNEGSAKLQELRKHFIEGIPMTIEQVGVSLIENLDHFSTGSPYGNQLADQDPTHSSSV